MIVDFICKIKKLRDTAYLPEYAHDDDSGCDCRSVDMMIIKAGERVKVPLGFAIESPRRIDTQIRPRSSMSNKGIYASFGTVDAGYRGEVCVQLWNSTDRDYIVHRGDKIAQLVFVPVERAEFVVCEELTPSQRSTGGFGSTGK